jgi:hypothetical protein
MNESYNYDVYLITTYICYPVSGIGKLNQESDIRTNLNQVCMFLTMSVATGLVSVACMIFSLVVIIASIGWIKDMYKMKRKVSDKKIGG